MGSSSKGSGGAHLGGRCFGSPNAHSMHYRVSEIGRRQGQLLLCSFFFFHSDFLSAQGRPGVSIQCNACERQFHVKCLFEKGQLERENISQKDAENLDFVCSECEGDFGDKLGEVDAVSPSPIVVRRSSRNSGKIN